MESLQDQPEGLARLFARRRRLEDRGRGDERQRSHSPHPTRDGYDFDDRGKRNQISHRRTLDIIFIAAAVRAVMYNNQRNEITRRRENHTKMRIIIVSLLFIACGAALAQQQAEPQKGKEMTPEKNKLFEGEVNAPDFPLGMEWLNTEKSVSLRDLRGKIVLLDFWTYCCINCMHIIPDLKKLEAKYANQLVVIGVHSAKFLNEKGAEQIRQAILRYEIEHPVVNDKDFEVWQSYTARAWPTLVLINPKGKVVGSHSGEGAFDAFDG